MICCPAQKTDWDAYYQSPALLANLTRKITTRRLLTVLRKINPRQPMRICELGGANSCFAAPLCRSLEIGAYHVIDNNSHGLRLLADETPNAPLTWENSDVLSISPPPQRFDLVYSVGLIEHFDYAGTALAVQSHFQLCKSGGVVLITFPTPTLPYRAIRHAAEALSMWSFPDERPLSCSEVARVGQDFGIKVHQSINWWIGLTQGFIAWRAL